jgi:hypothetical protein
MYNNNDDKPGYGKPPKSGQFKKGQSGNPRGRPKKSRDLASIVRGLLDAVVEVKVGGEVKRMTKLEAMLLQDGQKALLGEDRSLSRVLSLVKQLSTHPTEEPEGKYGVLYVQAPCVCPEEWMIRYGSDFRLSYEGIDKFEEGVRAQCATWREELRKREAEEAELRAKHGARFPGLPGPGRP